MGAALLQSGCAGLGISGWIEAVYTFKRVERIDPDQNPYGVSRYVWHPGEGTSQIVAGVTTQASVTDLDGNVTTEVNRAPSSACAATSRPSSAPMAWPLAQSI